jgi:hypothetical protein
MMAILRDARLRRAPQDDDSRKTSRRVVNLELPGVPEQIWQLDLPSDPDPTPGYSPWRLASSTTAPKIEMNFRLSADR